MKSNNSEQVFLALLRAGLWEKDVLLSSYGDLNYDIIMKMAEEQSVVGLITAGLEHVKDVKVPKDKTLLFVGSTLQIEQRNKAMNDFIARLFTRLQHEGLNVVLVKGQGVAQCYERPLWRVCGDVDLLMNKEVYERAKQVLLPTAQSIEPEYKSILHQGMTIDNIVVELHGTLKAGVTTQMDNGIEELEEDTLAERKVRAWNNNNVAVYQPCPDNDIILVFTHILDHFFKGGIGLRQICDWCRLLWVYRDSIDPALLEKRVNKLGIKSEWKVFSCLAVDYLGMPEDALPFYEDFSKWKKKSGKALSFIMRAGNFGHNIEKVHHRDKSFIHRKAISLLIHTRDAKNVLTIFPLDTMRMWNRMLFEGLKVAIIENK